MLKLAQTRNPIINLSDAMEALIAATKDKRTDIATITGQILAHLDRPEAQDAIVSMAILEKNPLAVRISGFNSLAISFKCIV